MTSFHNLLPTVCDMGSSLLLPTGAESYSTSYPVLLREMSIGMVPVLVVTCGKHALMVLTMADVVGNTVNLNAGAVVTVLKPEPQQHSKRIVTTTTTTLMTIMSIAST